MLEQAQPAAEQTGTMPQWSSSHSPAFRHCWFVLAPIKMTFLPPAAGLALATALGTPSVTKATDSDWVSFGFFSGI